MTSDAPLKTLHLTNAYHPTSGGVRTVYQSLLDAANRLERPVRLVVPGPDHRIEDVGRFGRIYHVEAPRAFAVDRRYRLIMPSRYLLPWVNGVRDILRREQPDIVEVCDKHSLCYVAGLLRKGWIAGVQRPTLVATSAERFDDNIATFLGTHRPGAAFAHWFMRAIYAPMFDYHIANSPYTAEELLSALPPHRQAAVHVIPPSLRADAFEVQDGRQTRQALLAQTAGNKDTRLLVYAGRLSREKNLGLLVEMLGHLRRCERLDGVNYRLVLAGEGPERRPLEAARAGLGGRLHMLGNVSSRSALRQLLAAADVFVHPNPREPFGLAPLEAMASGLPVVVPDRGGVRSYADPSTAWLARPTAEEFAGAVRAVVSRPALAEARAAAALDRASEYHEDQVLRRYFTLLDHLHRQRRNVQAATTPEATAGLTVGAPATSR